MLHNCDGTQKSKQMQRYTQPKSVKIILKMLIKQMCIFIILEYVEYIFSSMLICKLIFLLR